jgi:glycolate oxidase
MPSLLETFESLLGKHRVFSTRDALLAWECDGFTVHRSLPRMVVLPESTAEVQAVVRRCTARVSVRAARRRHLPVGWTYRGTDTVVIDLARMRRCCTCDRRSLRGRATGRRQPRPDHAVHHLGLHYAPDPSSQSVCTIGGNLAENSGGPHCFKYGMTVDHVLGALIVLPDGELARLGDRRSTPAAWARSRGRVLRQRGHVRHRDRDHGALVPQSREHPHAARRVLDDDRRVSDGQRHRRRRSRPRGNRDPRPGHDPRRRGLVYRAGYPVDAAAVLLVEFDGPDAVLEEEAMKSARSSSDMARCGSRKRATPRIGNGCGRAARARSVRWAA